MSTATALMTADQFPLAEMAMIPTNLNPRTADPSRLTAEEFYRANYDTWTELVRGVPVPMIRPDLRHGVVCANASFLLTMWARAKESGIVVSNDAGVVTERNPDTIRGPDVMFVPNEQLPEGNVPEGFADLVPSLVVEILSLGETWTLILKKTAEYLIRGVREAWVLNPESRRLFRFFDDESPEFHAESEMVQSESVLAGFSCEVSQFFHGL